MFLCNISTSAWASGTPITFASTPSVSTNGNVKLNSSTNGALVVNPGWYDVRLQATVTSSGTEIGAYISANGNPISNSEATVTLATGDDGLIDIEYPVHVVASDDNTAQALIQIVPTATGTPTNGYISITKIQ